MIAELLRTTRHCIERELAMFPEVYARVGLELQQTCTMMAWMEEQLDPQAPQRMAPVEVRDGRP